MRTYPNFAFGVGMLMVLSLIIASFLWAVIHLAGYDTVFLIDWFVVAMVILKFG